MRINLLKISLKAFQLCCVVFIVLTIVLSGQMISKDANVYAADASSEETYIRDIPKKSAGIITDMTGTLSQKDMDEMGVKIDQQFSTIDVTPYVIVTEDIPDGLSPDTYARNVRNKWNITYSDALFIVISDKGIGLSGPTDGHSKGKNNVSSVLYHSSELKDDSVVDAAMHKQYLKALKQLNKIDVTKNRKPDVKTQKANDILDIICKIAFKIIKCIFWLVIVCLCIQVVFGVISKIWS